jgi:hypothetical protein
MRNADERALRRGPQRSVREWGAVQAHEQLTHEAAPEDVALIGRAATRGEQPHQPQALGCLFRPAAVEEALQERSILRQNRQALSLQNFANTQQWATMEQCRHRMMGCRQRKGVLRKDGWE